MTLPSSVTEAPETDSDRVSEERLRGAARDLLGALQKYGFPVSDAATRQLMDGGSLEAQAVHVAAKGLATALRTTPSLPPRSGGVVVKGLEWSEFIDTGDVISPMRLTSTSEQVFGLTHYTIADFREDPSIGHVSWYLDHDHVAAPLDICA